MNKKTKTILFGIIAVAVVIGAVLLLPKAAPEAQATIPVSYDIPVELDGDTIDFQFLDNVGIYSDEACTQLVTDATLQTDAMEGASVAFAVTPDADTLYVQVPAYISAQNTETYSVQLSDTQEVYLNIGGEACFKLSEVTINQEVPKTMIPSGGSILVEFEAIGEQMFHPGDSTMVIDGETYYGGFSAIYDENETTGTDYCESFSCMFLIPDDIEVDVNDLVISFDSEYEINQGFVATYNPGAVTE